MISVIELFEDAKENAKGTLTAIINATKDKGGDIHKMALGMKKSFDKNGGFSKDQAKWIYNTSKAMFKG
jgi:hypothetical protein